MAARRLLAGAVLAFGLLVVVRIVSLAVADRWADARPGRALAWVAEHPDALLARARQALARGQLAKARDDARHALALAPLSAQGYSLLAQVARRGGTEADRERLDAIAARRNPRDVEARAWIAQRALMRHDDRAAVAQLAAILRVAPWQSRVLLPRMALLARDPSFAAALGPVLSARPAWRAPFVAELVAKDAADDVALSRLDAAGALDDTEFAAWLEALVSGGRSGEAYARWVGRRPPTQQRVANLSNPRFDAARFGTAFGWQRPSLPGASFTTGDDGRAAIAWQVQVEEPGDVYLSQHLRLLPGVYTIVVDMRVEPEFPADPRAIAPRWSLTCVGGQRNLAEAGPETDGAWHQVTLVAAIPADCPDQRLVLAARSDTVGGERAMRVAVAAAVLTPQSVALDGQGTVTPVASIHGVRGRVLRGDRAGFVPVLGEGPHRFMAGQRLLLAPGASALLGAPAGCAGRIDRAGIYDATGLCAARTTWDPTVDTRASPMTRSLAAAVHALPAPQAPVPTGR